MGLLYLILVLSVMRDSGVRDTVEDGGF